MSAAVDASSPGRSSVVDTSATASVATAPFTPPNNSLLVVAIQWDTFNANSAENFSFQITNSGTPLAWTTQVERTGLELTAGGGAGIYTAPMPAGAAITVTATKINGGIGSTGTGRISMKVYVVTGADLAGTPVAPISASNEGTGSTQTNFALTALTPSADGLQFVSVTDWNTRGAISSADLTVDHAEYAGQIDVASGYLAVAGGVATTAHLTAGAAAPQWKWTDVLVLASPTLYAVFVGEPITGSSLIEGGLR